MKPFVTVIALFAVFFVTARSQPVTAQEPALGVAEYVARAQRLREFGFPLNAREQLDKGKQLDPVNRELLLEYLRLYNNYQDATTREMQGYVGALRTLFPNDYEVCLEIAWWLHYVEPLQDPPRFKDETELKRVLQRLDAEMIVYRELAKYILKPEGELPQSAEGTPALPLAFLARCAGAKPGTADVYFFAARDLERRALDFDQWATTAEELGQPFSLAANELYGLLLPLYQEAAKTDAYNVGAKVNVAQTLYRMGRYEESHKACVAAEIQAPQNITIAETRLAIAEELRDYGLLTDALTRLHAIYDDISSELDLMVVQRLVLNDWGFETWLAWREIAVIERQRFAERVMLVEKRADAIRTLILARPTFLELYYLDARNALELASLSDNDPDKRRHLYTVTLSALDKCEPLGETFADWHGLRAAALWELGRFDDAALAYDLVAGLDADDTEAVKHARAAREIAAGKYTARDYEAYRLQLEYGDLRGKRDVLKLVTTRSPKFFEAQLLLGKVGFMLADFQLAYSAYGAGHKLAPENLECLDGVARAAMRTERYGESLQFFVKLNEAEPDFQGAKRWEGILRWVVDGTDSRRTAFRMWLEASGAQQEEKTRINLLEQAVLLEPAFAEALVDLAGLQRERNNKLAANYVEQAIKTARDDYTRAAAHRERGRLRLSLREHAGAVNDFDSAYAYNKGDGTDLLLGALSNHALGRESEAASGMRKLFAEVPNTPLLRPPVRDAATLDLVPVASDGVRDVHPAYDVGDVARFGVRIEVSGEGGQQSGRDISLEYDLRMEVLDKPLHGGVWRVRVSAENAPKEFAALNKLDIELSISPWFGLLNEPEVAGLGEIINPGLQALTEGLTVGIGDAPIPPPYLWKTDLTMGPPHFGGDSIEGAAMVEVLGESMVVLRRALAGRQLGQHEEQHNFSRALEARVSVGGNKRALREVEFQILKKELTPARDDVVKSRLYVKLTAR
ncbi:MAG: hypothetical protein K8I27_17030 [Planctomycetes bacterium]|nr:hypothetical protein [Planctomycetota bacterium]